MADISGTLIARRASTGRATNGGPCHSRITVTLAHPAIRGSGLPGLGALWSSSLSRDQRVPAEGTSSAPRRVPVAPDISFMAVCPGGHRRSVPWHSNAAVAITSGGLKEPVDLRSFGEHVVDASRMIAGQVPRQRVDCLIPGFDGAPLSGDLRDALWDKFFTAAPQRQRRSVERYSIVKRA